MTESRTSERAEASTFGMLLRRHRRAAGLTQEALAALAGQSRRGLQHLEAGEALPHPATLEALTAALALPPEDQAELWAAGRPTRAGKDGPPRRQRMRSARTHLPLPITSFVGREHEIGVLSDLLRRDDVRLLTVTGPPGVGKTRLSQHVAGALADDFLDGVYFVPLAPLRDPDLVLPTIGQAVGARHAHLTDFLAAKRVLLVLDNFEHLLAAGPRVAELLAACPGPKVLATSRESLALYGEREFTLRPLPLPDVQSPATLLAGNDAVRLFVERAAAADAEFSLSDDNAAAVAQICRRLDGLPLALELAAARTRLLPPATLAVRLEQRLGALAVGARDVPTRHRTLGDALAWSYELLTAAEQALFRRISVFAGGWTLEAAQAVCGKDAQTEDMLDWLGSLAAKSLLHPVPGPVEEPRFAMLETTREYAADLLESAHESQALRAAHANHFIALAERAHPEHYGRAQLVWLERVEREHDNLRAALRYFVEGGDSRRGTRLAAALRRFWWIRGHTDEARIWFTTLVEHARRDHAHCAGAQTTLARALTGAALFAYLENMSAALGLLAGEAVALCRRLDDREMLAEALHLLGHYYLDPGTDYEAARTLFDESATEYCAVAANWGVGWSLHCLATSVWLIGDNEAARRAYEETLRLFRLVGDENMAAHPLGTLGFLAFERGERGRGRELVEESVARFRAFNDHQYLGFALRRGGDLACRDGDFGAAYLAYHESLTLALEAGASNQLLSAFEGFAMLAAAQAQPERALHLAGAAAAMRDTAGNPGKPAEQARLERALAVARVALGSAAEAAWQRGRRMSTQEAVDAALAAPSGPARARVSYKREREENGQRSSHG